MFTSPLRSLFSAIWQFGYSCTFSHLQNCSCFMMSHDICTSLCSALFTITKTWRQPKCPLRDQRAKKTWCSGILLSRKKWNNSIFNNTDRPRDYHTKWSKSETQILYDITYMWNLKYDTDKLIYKAEMDSQAQGTDLWLSRGREMGRNGLWVWA